MTLSGAASQLRGVYEPKVAEGDIRQGHETKRNDSVSLILFARTENIVLQVYLVGMI